MLVKLTMLLEEVGARRIPLEPSPLGVKVVAQCDDDDDVAQHAQATSKAAENPR